MITEVAAVNFRQNPGDLAEDYAATPIEDGLAEIDTLVADPRKHP